MKNVLKRIKQILKLERNEIIAFFYYFAGKKLSCSTFIDEVTITHGYGKLDGNIGIWEYQLPFWFTKKWDKDE